MQLCFKLIDKTLVVSITGEIDHHTAENAREKIDSFIDSHSVKNIVFDFNGVSFMDSAGIGVIIGRYKKVTPHGGRIAIVNTRPPIKRILEISGIFKISKSFEKIDDAISNL
jgi:stage II sporulation protein AA (anti-sigma F factor antagonist)